VSQYPVEDPLVVIILAGPPRVEGIADEPEDHLHALLFREGRVEALAEAAHDTARPRLEAGEAAARHHLDEEEDVVAVLAASEEALDAQNLEVVKELAAAPL